jgi:hypothetical protein
VPLPQLAVVWVLKNPHVDTVLVGARVITSAARWRHYRLIFTPPGTANSSARERRPVDVPDFRV